MKRRFMSILLTLCMALSLVAPPLSASAASSTNKPPTVDVEGVEVLADGDYYLQILGKWVYPIVTTSAVWIELSDRKPDKPFKVSRLSYDKNSGPKYSISYDGRGIGVQSISGQQLSSMYAPNWKISVYSGFCTIRDYTNQALLVNASGESSNNGTKIIVWTNNGSTPEHAKVTFFTPENAPDGPTIPLLSTTPAPTGTSTTLADGWYRLKMGGDAQNMNGYVDLDAKGGAEMRERGSMEIHNGSTRTDSQKFYLQNKGSGQITLRATDGKYLGIDGSIKAGVQMKKVDTPFVWKVSFSKVPGAQGDSNIVYSGLRPSKNKDLVAAATLFMAKGNFLSDEYVIMEGSKIVLRKSPNTTPLNAGFAFIPVSVPTSSSWYTAPKSGTGGHTKSLTMGDTTLKISNVYSMGANINVPGRQDTSGYLCHYYFIVAATPGTIKVANFKKSNMGYILYWPLNTIGYSDKSVPKPIYPDRDYAADYDDAEYLSLKKGTTSIANNVCYSITYADEKPISGFRNGNLWTIQIFFVDAKTAAGSVGIPKKYPAGKGSNDGTYVVYSVK